MDIIDENLRNSALSASDDELLAACTMDFFKSTGKGGQKRNKTSSAVRLIHRPTGVAVTDCSERSQHRNRQAALQKLRLAIALQCRATPAAMPANPECGVTNAAFFLNMAQLIDMFYACNGNHFQVAETLGLSASKTVKILAKEPQILNAVNTIRQSHQLGPLHP